MDKEKIILLIVGAIIGFVVSLAKDWLMEGKKQKEKEKQFKREKLEEISHLLFKRYKYLSDIYSGAAIDIASGDTSDIVLNKMADNVEKHNIDNRLEILINLYFEELRDTWNKWQNIQEKFGMKFLTESIMNNEKIEYAEKLNIYFGKLLEIKNELDSKIKSLADSYGF